MNLFRARLGRPLVIGHRGAAAVAPENTLASSQAAVDAGADIVEFDISPGLRLGHSLGELPEDELSLDEALEFLGGHDVGLHLDVKLPGLRGRGAEAVRRHGLEERRTSRPPSRDRRGGSRPRAGQHRAIGYPRDRIGSRSALARSR